MKKIGIFLIACMFILSMLPGIIGEADDNKVELRKFIENRDVIPIYTAQGFEKVPNEKGKPGTYVEITSPTNGITVSDIVTITVDSSDNNPAILIDGAVVGRGLTYDWDTSGYVDGPHTIEASAKGHTDSITVTVDNGGGGENTAPTVEITNPADSSTVSGLVTVTVDATDVEDGTITPDIYIDDVLVTTGSSYDWDTNGLVDGSIHTIYAEATDSGSLTGSDSIAVTVDNSGGGDGEVEKYALVIGISDYRGRLNDLNYCDDDAREWKSFLEGKGYSVTILTDKKALADNIVAEIDNLLALEDGNDQVVLTYSGHGAKYTGYGSCIISHDLYYIDHSYFESKFANADSSHIYFTFDACVIGDFQGLITNGRVGAFGSDNEYSYESPEFRNGVFTYYQMEGWNSYNNFEEDSNYAVNQMNNWGGNSVDPFYVDNYDSGDDGYMYP